MVSASTGKKPQVAPYSGAMLPMVALSADRKIIEAGAEELDEFSDHALLAQHLRHRQHQIGRGDAFLQLSLELEADHFRQQHRQRLAQHCGFRFDEQYD